MKTTLLIDGDILIYRAASASLVDVEFPNKKWGICGDLDEAVQILEAEVGALQKKLSAKDVVFCISDHGANWRKEVMPSYKANRKGNRRPPHYLAIEEYTKQRWGARAYPKLEADDVMGMLSTGKKIGGRKIIVSIDKDMRTIPGFLYSAMHKDLGVQEITKAEANRYHLLQTLMGDAVDGYPGCPGVGPKRAEKVLGDLTGKAAWDTIVATYEKAGATEEDALQNARVAHIMRAGDYKIRTKEVKLWTPPKR